MRDEAAVVVSDERCHSRQREKFFFSFLSQLALDSSCNTCLYFISGLRVFRVIPVQFLLF